MSDAATPPPEDQPMEIHKPRPIRHWRELLTEIGVIVLSVSIALAGEQAVEWLHWHNEVATARKTPDGPVLATVAGSCVDVMRGRVEV